MRTYSGFARVREAVEAGGDWVWTDARTNTASTGLAQFTPTAVTALDAALGYARRGWRIVPIPSGQKRPAMPGWPDFEAKPADMPRLFGHGENIAVILGPTSADLRDIDLDCTEAVALADLYLPATEGVFGRPAKPRSHRLFISPGAVYKSFADPISGDTLLELRGPGRDGGAHLSLLPPSIADGEQRGWHSDVIAPRPIDACALRSSAAWLAIACLVARHVSHHAAERPGRDLPRLLWEWDHDLGRAAYRLLGQPAPDAPRCHPRLRTRQSRRDLKLAEIVHAIPNDCDWSGWNRIGMAIFAASDGSDEGFVVFDDWSAKSPKYQPHAVEERWRNYRRHPPSRIGIGSLILLARQC
jgi:hypothetical protein